MSIKSTYEITDDGLFVRKDTQDVEEILDSNTEEASSGVNDNRFANARKVATIPLVVLEALKTREMKDGGPIDINLVGYDPDHTYRFTRWLDDRDNSKFRTNNSRMGQSTRYV
jgi:hypothetical protein